MSKKLEYYGGDGFGGQKEIGKYTVIETITKEFTKYSEARAYYDELSEGRAFWDESRGGAELLDCWTVVKP